MELRDYTKEVAVIDVDLIVMEQPAAVCFLQDDDWVNIHKSDLPELIQVLTELHHKYKAETV
jgi:hypothetical protein